MQNFLAMWGSAAALVGAAYSGCDRVKTVALLATAIGANGGKFGGFLVNIIDIAPNYAGILMGIINTISSVPGILAPWTAGWIINGNVSNYTKINSFLFRIKLNGCFYAYKLLFYKVIIGTCSFL